ncbi:unnamed protein product [Peniophora sp. CBMAI 1063]|nr:unnamed protein product [Peniophora sp. CBMAI 1063]
MFYYISFLRPPPTATVLGAPVAFTPQVSNDLRTENFPGSVDIFYHWIDSTTGSQLSSAVKLTTWREANAYKELTVAPPPLRKPGQATLVLTSSQASGAREIDLRSLKYGKEPLPVYSTPIVFGARSAGKARKQEAVERRFRLFDSDDGGSLQVREMTSFDLDKKLWDSGVGLSGWLVRLSAEPTSNLHLKEALWDAVATETELRVVELGAGTGVVSLVLAAVRNTLYPNAPTKILSTDLPSSIELMDYNVSGNASLYPIHPPHPIVLDWDDDGIPREVADMECIDIIMAADITYNTASYPSLVGTLSRLLAHSPEAIFLLAYKQRDLTERELWSMVSEHVSITLQKVDDVVGAGGQAVEIWIGKRASQNAHPALQS